MVNNLSIKTLVYIFLALAVAVAAFLLYDSNKGESSFSNNIISVDTAKITSISIFPKSFNHKEVKIFKEGSAWKVNLANGKKVVVPSDKVQEVLIQFSSIKPLSVAAQSADKWKEFSVDTSGTHVKVFEGNKNTLDMIIGKFTYQQPRSMTTYVRISGDDNVYLVNGFLDFTFNHNADYFRNDNVIKDNYANWNKLTFTYPADSSFQLTKVNGSWLIKGKEADSAKVFNYLTSVSNITIPNFIDNPNQILLTNSKYTLTIQSSEIGAIVVSAFADSTSIAITSSQHKDTYFDGKKADAWKRIFIGKSSLLNKRN
jgi:hypothetical protein